MLKFSEHWQVICIVYDDHVHALKSQRQLNYQIRMHIKGWFVFNRTGGEKKSPNPFRK